MADERKPTVVQRLEHSAYSGFTRLSALLGGGARARFGESLGALGYAPFKFRRAHVEKHLRIAFPDKDDAWIQATARAAYRHLGREGIAAMMMARVPRAELMSDAVVVGIEPLREAVSKGTGAVIMTGHIGNVEFVGAALAHHGIPIGLVVQRQGNPLFDATIKAARERMGMHVIDRGDAVRQVPKALRAGMALVFAPDQNAGRSGLFLPFFGKLASTHRGPAVFALKVGVPAFSAFALRKGLGYEVLVEPIDEDRTADKADVVHRMMLTFTQRLEKVVREAPEQYLWMHRRWKTRPPEERGPPIKV